MMTDPVADLLTRIRNAGSARHRETLCPSSKLKVAIASLLKEEGFIGDLRVEVREGHPTMVLGIRYDDEGKALIGGIRRVSKPGRRVYVTKDEVPRIRHGLGVAVISTSKGILSDRAAREASVGGEVLCEVW
jgi:small subunit ribosomal protein S8